TPRIPLSLRVRRYGAAGWHNLVIRGFGFPPSSGQPGAAPAVGRPEPPRRSSVPHAPIPRRLNVTRSLALALLLPLAACAADEQASRPSPTVHRSDHADAPRPLGAAGAARAGLRPVGRAGASGTARLTRFDAGVRVELRAEGLSEGLHGVAVYDATACDELGTSGHFDPE